MSVTVIVSLKVADFDDWKAAFDAHAIARSEAGIDVKAYRNMDDPDNPIAIGTASSKETFIAFLQSQKCRKSKNNQAYLTRLI